MLIYIIAVSTSSDSCSSPCYRQQSVVDETPRSSAPTRAPLREISLLKLKDTIEDIYASKVQYNDIVRYVIKNYYKNIWERLRILLMLNRPNLIRSVWMRGYHVRQWSNICIHTLTRNMA